MTLIKISCSFHVVLLRNDFLTDTLYQMLAMGWEFRWVTDCVLVCFFDVKRLAILTWRYDQGRGVTHERLADLSCQFDLFIGKTDFGLVCLCIALLLRP